MTGMHFALSPGTITVTDDRTGKYPTLFGPRGDKLVFQDAGSSFNDSEGLYRYVFRGDLVEGEACVFATAEREVVGRLVGGAVQIEERLAGVTRAPSGAPLCVQGIPKPRMTIMIVTMNPGRYTCVPSGRHASVRSCVFQRNLHGRGVR